MPQDASAHRQISKSDESPCSGKSHLLGLRHSWVWRNNNGCAALFGTTVSPAASAGSQWTIDDQQREFEPMTFGNNRTNTIPCRSGSSADQSRP